MTVSTQETLPSLGVNDGKCLVHPDIDGLIIKCLTVHDRKTLRLVNKTLKSRVDETVQLLRGWGYGDGRIDIETLVKSQWRLKRLFIYGQSTPDRVHHRKYAQEFNAFFAGYKRFEDLESLMLLGFDFSDGLDALVDLANITTSFPKLTHLMIKIDYSHYAPAPRVRLTLQPLFWEQLSKCDFVSRLKNICLLARWSESLTQFIYACTGVQTLDLTVLHPTPDVIKALAGAACSKTLEELTWFGTCRNGGAMQELGESDFPALKALTLKDFDTPVIGLKAFIQPWNWKEASWASQLTRLEFDNCACKYTHLVENLKCCKILKELVIKSRDSKACTRVVESIEHLQKLEKLIINGTIKECSNPIAL